VTNISESKPVKWPTLDELAIQAPLPFGYRYAFLTRPEIPEVIDALGLWYPGIAVGNAGCHMRESFYGEKVYLGDHDDRDFLVTLLKFMRNWSGFFPLNATLTAESFMAALAQSPQHIADRI
jgi:hypothetical protein